MEFQAILTKVLPATNTRPTRIKATAASGLSVTISKTDENAEVYAHTRAVEKLCRKLGWANMHGHWGATKDGYAFVFSVPNDVGMTFNRSNKR